MTHNQTVVTELDTFEEHQRTLHAYENGLAENTKKSNESALNSLDRSLEAIYSDYQTVAEEWFEVFVEGKKPATRVQASQLKTFYRLRDTAFFSAMEALKQQQEDDIRQSDTIETRDSQPIPLVPTLVFIEPYYRFEKEKETLLHTIDLNIASLLAVQKSWTEFLIECLSPFILKFFNYESVQTRITKQVTQLTQDYLFESEHLDEERQAFSVAYKAAYAIDPPKDISLFYTQLSENNRSLAANIDQFGDIELKTHHQNYLTEHKANDLLHCYRRICQLEYTAQKTAMNPFWGELKIKIHTLHPNMSSLLNKTEAQCYEECGLIDTIKDTHNNHQDTYKQYLFILHQLYTEFLKANDTTSLAKLYRHITAPALHKDNPLLQLMLAHLQQYHSSKIKQVMGTPFIYLKKSMCDAMLSRYLPVPPRKAVHFQAVRLLTCPTWENLFALEQAIIEDETGYYYDDKVKTLIDELMQSIVKQPQAEEIAELIPVTYSHSDDSLQVAETKTVLTPVSYEKNLQIPALFSNTIESHKTTTYNTMMQLSTKLIDEPGYSLSALRNDAFFEHQFAIQTQKYQRIYASTSMLTDYSALTVPATMHHTTPIQSTLDRLDRYLKVTTKLKDKLELIRSQQKKSQKDLFKEQNQLKNHLYIVKDKLETQWQDMYHCSTPNNLEQEKEHLQYLLTDMEQAIEQYDDVDLNHHFQTFLTTHSPEAFIALCQQVSLCQHYDKMSNTPSRILSTLQALYPDYSDILTQTTQEITEKLCWNDTLYRVAMTIQNHSDPLMAALHIKLRHFLNEKSEYHFALLHQQLTGHASYESYPETMQTLDALQKLYPERTAKLLETHHIRLSHIKTNACYELFKNYQRFASKSPVLSAIKSFLALPTLHHLITLKSMLIQHPDYINDPKLSKLVFLVMDACMIKPQQYHSVIGFFNADPEQNNRHTIRDYMNDTTSIREVTIEAAAAKCNQAFSNIHTQYQKHKDFSNYYHWHSINKVFAIVDDYCDVLKDNTLSSNTDELALYAEVIQHLKYTRKMLKFYADNNSDLKELLSECKNKIQESNYHLKDALIFIIEVFKETREYNVYLQCIPELTNNEYGCSVK